MLTQLEESKLGYSLTKNGLKIFLDKEKHVSKLVYFKKSMS